MRKVIFITGIVVFLIGLFGYAYVAISSGDWEGWEGFGFFVLWFLSMLIGNLVLVVLVVIHLVLSFLHRENGKFGKEMIEAFRALLIGLFGLLILMPFASAPFKPLLAGVSACLLVAAVWYFLGRLGSKSKKEVQA